MYIEPVTTEQYPIKSDGLETRPAQALNQTDAPVFFASPCRIPAKSDFEQAVTSPALVHLNLEDLKCFEVVDRQFQRWGVTFHNCIAIHPSNPAFPAHSGTTVLMGSPKSGWLEASFTHPVCVVKAYVTTSQRLVLSAYDRDNQRLAQAEISEPNLAGSDSKLQPNTVLSIRMANIYRVTFCAFDGQFTVDDLSFQF